MDYEGIKTLLSRGRPSIPSPFSPVAGGGLPRRGEGCRDWVEKKTLGGSVDVVERPKKPAPEEVL
jgi:hypothetical protein